MQRWILGLMAVFSVAIVVIAITLDGRDNRTLTYTYSPNLLQSSAVSALVLWG